MEAVREGTAPGTKRDGVPGANEACGLAPAERIGSMRPVRSAPACADRPPRFRLEVDGKVPPDILAVAEQALAELNCVGAHAEARTAALQLSDALTDVRLRGHRAWLVSA